MPLRERRASPDRRRLSEPTRTVRAEVADSKAGPRAEAVSLARGRIMQTLGRVRRLVIETMHEADRLRAGMATSSRQPQSMVPTRRHQRTPWELGVLALQLATWLRHSNRPDKRSHPQGARRLLDNRRPQQKLDPRAKALGAAWGQTSSRLKARATAPNGDRPCRTHRPLRRGGLARTSPCRRRLPTRVGQRRNSGFQKEERIARPQAAVRDLACAPKAPLARESPGPSRLAPAEQETILQATALRRVRKAVARRRVRKAEAKDVMPMQTTLPIRTRRQVARQQCRRRDHQGHQSRRKDHWRHWTPTVPLRTSPTAQICHLSMQYWT